MLQWHGRIDVLVNNAGILYRKMISNYTEADGRQALYVNLTGTFLGVSQVAPIMSVRRGGAIANIASNAALAGHADPAYTASK